MPKLSSSGCLPNLGMYEEKREYTNALEYTLLARDKYKFGNGCGTCQQHVEESLDKRIKYLETAVKRAKEKGS